MQVDLANDIALNLDCSIVVGPVPLAQTVEGSAGLVPSVFRVVASLVAKIDAATEAVLAIQKHYFFMVAGSKGMAGIEDEVDSGVEFRPKSGLEFLPFEDIETRMVPEQKVSVKGGIGFTNSFELGGQRLVKAPRGLKGKPGVDLPAQENGVTATGFQQLAQAISIGTGLFPVLPNRRRG
jgi:hypothetical protein